MGDLLGSVPSQEQVLLQRLPPSHREGAFPRSLLAPNERIVFETKPRLVGFVGVPLLVSVIWSMIWGGAFIATFNVANWAGEVAAIIILIAPVWCWPLLRFRNWRGSAYALTDVRVVRRSGSGGSQLQDARYDLVQQVQSDGTTLRFRIARIAGAGAAYHGGGLLGDQVVWKDVEFAAQVQVFAQAFIALYAQKIRDDQILQALRLRATANKVTCAYCKSLVDLAVLPAQRFKCPNCSAPILPPG